MIKNEEIESEIKTLFQNLGVEGTIAVVDEEEGEKRVQIATPDSGLLIGRMGKHLEALQTFVNVLFFQKGLSGKIILDIGDFRKLREEKLKNLAQKIAEGVKQEKRAKEIPNLAPWERRIIHLFLSKDSEVATYSEGEDKERKIIVYPKMKNQKQPETLAKGKRKRSELPGKNEENLP